MYSKHKDSLPSDTVNEIKKIYESIDLNMEYDMEMHIEGAYSAHIYDVKGRWATAGKGTTQEYCLASAYGESIEHICNHFAFDISTVNKDAKQYLDFYRYPDEQLLFIKDVATISPLVYKDMINAYQLIDNKPENLEVITHIWEEIFDCEKTPFIPYYSVREKKSVLLPDAILSKMCGSNGGGSGNTPHEALGHALDEVIERYVKYKIIYDQLTPPVIPIEYIKQASEELYGLINRINKQGDLSIIVKDASLGKGYSVVCIILVDKKSQRYLVNFGAHPFFEVALERCITEVFQDHDCVQELIPRDDMMIWKNISIDYILGLRNWVSLLCDDIGYVPNSLFLTQPSWEFVPWTVHENYNNIKGMQMQLNVLMQNNLDVYIRNNSFLGFSVFKVYIPGFSVSHINFDERVIDTIKTCERLFEFFDFNITVEDKIQMKEYLFGKDSFLAELSLTQLSIADYDLIHAGILFDIGNSSEAKTVISEIDYPIAKCLQQFILLKECCNDINVIRDLLEMFFPEDVSCWIEKFENKNAFEAIIKELKINGELKEVKNDSKIETALFEKSELYKRVKEKFKSNLINQDSLADIL